MQWKTDCKERAKAMQTERFETEMLLFRSCKLAKIMHVREQVAKMLAGLGSLVFFYLSTTCQQVRSYRYSSPSSNFPCREVSSLGSACPRIQRWRASCWPLCRSTARCRAPKVQCSAYRESWCPRAIHLCSWQAQSPCWPWLHRQPKPRARMAQWCQCSGAGRTPCHPLWSPELPHHLPCRHQPCPLPNFSAAMTPFPGLQCIRSADGLQLHMVACLSSCAIFPFTYETMESLCSKQLGSHQFPMYCGKQGLGLVLCPLAFQKASGVHFHNPATFGIIHS